MVYQRDIVEVHFGDEIGAHPVIVLSNNLVHEVETSFVGVMMTSKPQDDEFTFLLTNEMVVKPLQKEHSEVRCHLINYFSIDDVIPNGNRNQLKVAAFKQLLKKISQTTFSTEEL